MALVECIPHPFKILKSPYLSKLSGKFLKTSQNSALYHLVHYFDFEKNRIDRKHTSISPLELKLQRFWYSDCMNYVPLILLFCYYFPFFTSPFSLLERWNALNALNFEHRGRARYVFYWTHQILVEFKSKQTMPLS